MKTEQEEEVRRREQEEEVRGILAELIITRKLSAAQITQLANVLPAMLSREITVSIRSGSINIHLDDDNVITWVGFPMKRLLDEGDKIISANGVPIDDNKEAFLAGTLHPDGCTLTVRTGVMRLAGYVPERYPDMHDRDHCKHFGERTAVHKQWYLRLPDRFIYNFTFNENRSPLSLSQALSLADLLVFGFQNRELVDDESPLQQQLKNYTAGRPGMKVMNLDGSTVNVAEMFSGANFYGVPNTGIVLIGTRSNLWNEELRYILYNPQAGIIFPDWEGGIAAFGKGIREKAERIIQGTDGQQDLTNMLQIFFKKIHKELDGKHSSNHKTCSIASFTWLYMERKQSSRQIVHPDYEL